MPGTPQPADQYGRRDMDELYHELAAAAECEDAGALANVAWSLYAQLGTVTAELAGLRARLHTTPLGSAA